MSKKTLITTLVLCAPILAACSSTSSAPEKMPTHLQSSPSLTKETANANAYIYRAPDIDASRYNSILLDPVDLYGGPEANFGDYTMADKQRFASFMADAFRTTLSQKYRMAQAAGPGVMKIRVTLIGVDGTVGGVATLTRVVPIGLAVNAVRGAAGGEGAMTGSIEYAVEVFDSQTNQLLASAVRRQAPAVFDMEATLSTDETVKSSAQAAAEMVRDAIAKRAPQMAAR